MKSKDQTLLEEAYESIRKNVETIPTVGQIYKWIGYDSTVKILDVEETKTSTKEYEDGSITGPSTRYTVKIKDVTPGGKYEGTVLRTPFTSAGFKLLK
jgi:hypothetical protein